MDIKQTNKQWLLKEQTYESLSNPVIEYRSLMRYLLSTDTTESSYCSQAI